MSSNTRPDLTLDGIPAVPNVTANIRQPARAAWAVPAWVAYAVPAGLALVLGALFLTSAHGSQDDDGYIFYQYARNLATGHGLSFNPGEVSYGVTSGAWVLLLAAVHALLRADIVVEGQWLGLGLFALSGALWAVALARWSGRPLLGALGALAYVLELDALKASLNGLETGLNLAVIAALVALVAGRPWAHPFVLGGICGVALLTRPDNVVWVAAAFLYSLLVARDAPATDARRPRGRAGLAAALHLPHAAFAGLAAAVVAAPWYAWLWATTGSPIPPTQTGKLLVFLPMNLGLTWPEYGHLSPIGRLGIGLHAVAAFALSEGPVRVAVAGVLLLAALAGLLAWRPATRRYAAWPLLLVGALLLQALLYAWSFPLVKLRYLVQVLPIGLGAAVAALGLLATAHSAPIAARLSRLAPLNAPVVRRYAWFLLLPLALVGLFFYSREMGRQISNYRYYVAVQDVRNDVGRWLHDHTPAGSLVALEPIGSVTFYSDRPVLDLGGLIDPTTWPALTRGYGDAPAVAGLLRARHAAYLVDYTHPDGVGGVSAALAQLPGAHPVAVVESAAALAGSRPEYGSYTIYQLPAAPGP